MNAIIVPVDFSPVSLNAVHYATKLALAKGASLVLLNTYQIPLTMSEVPVATVTVEELSEISRLRLAELKTSLEHTTSRTIKFYTESRLGDVVGALEELCGSLQPSAVVMGTTGHGQMHDFFVGSNTSEAMKRLVYPLIVVPPGAVFKTPKNIGLACDMEGVVDNLPSDKIHELVRWFDSNLFVLNVRPVGEVMGVDMNTESLFADTLLADLKPSYSFLTGEEVSDGLQTFAEKQNLDWLILIPKKHRGFSGFLKRSVSKQLAYQTHIPVVCIHA
jgi:nucleotide-binding universal stress UspA family protein